MTECVVCVIECVDGVIPYLHCVIEKVDGVIEFVACVIECLLF